MDTQRIRDRWPSILGGLDLLYHGVRAVLEWVGVIDLVVARVDDPSWIEGVINVIINPSPPVIVFMILGGLALIWWDIKWRQPADDLKSTTESEEETHTTEDTTASQVDTRKHRRRDLYEDWVAADIDEQRLRYLRKRTQTKEGREKLLDEWREVVNSHDFRIIEPEAPAIKGMVGTMSFRKETLYPELRPFLSEKTIEAIERNYPPMLHGLHGDPFAKVQRLIHRDLDLLERYWVPTESSPDTPSPGGGPARPSDSQI